MEESIFYKFAQGDIKPDTVRFEDDEMLAFDDISPSAKTHILIIPKKPIQSVAQMETGDQELLGKMVYRAKVLADELGLSENGYRLTFNIGKWGGQAVPYLHLHLIGGEPLNDNPAEFTHGKKA